MEGLLRYWLVVGFVSSACTSVRASEVRGAPPCAPCPVCPSADASPSAPAATGDVAGPPGTTDTSTPAPGPTLSPVTCSYGGVGPAAPPDTTPIEVPDVWVIAMVDVRAAAEVRGLRLESLKMLDASGGVAGRAQLPGELRVVPQERSLQDLSSYGSETFDGTIAAGATIRLWIHAALDVRWADLGQPVRYRAEFLVEGGGRLAVEGDVVGPWPTG